MSEGLPAPSLDEINAQPWDDVAREADIPTYSHISTKFSQKAAELENVGDATGSTVYLFLRHIVFIHLAPENKDQPLRPAWISPTGRSAAIEDFSEEARDTIERLIGSTSIPLLRARFADMIWLLRKNYKLAEEAATNYLAAFKAAADAEHWAYEFDCLKRGMALARMLGAKKQLFLEYVCFIETRLASLETTGTDSLGAGLLDLLFEYRVGDPSAAARIAESLGNRLEAAGNSSLAQTYFDLASRFHRANGDAPNTQRLGVKKAESLIAQAESCIGKEGQGYFSASHHLAIALECLRQSGGDETDINSLHKKLIDWQSKATAEMKSTSHEIDISAIIKGAEDRVRGKALPQAIFSMALGHSVVSPDELRKRVTGLMKDYPLSHMFGTSMMAPDGRVTAFKPGGLTEDEKTREIAIEVEMFHQASRIDWDLRARAYIDVCRQEIAREHQPSLVDLQFLVLHNPFIPPGHEMIFLKGILGGFRGDFDMAAHFLIPQVEEAIRHVLRSAGHITSKLDSKLIQEQRSLGILLGLPETTEILGADHVFELRGILVEKFGYDLRNRLAHGFLSYNECWGADVLNLWWLVIRLLSFPAARNAKENPPPSGEAKGDVT
ncbi:MAG: DUF4209 domain-containing protein [Blastocatellia bacterium]|nr:DUF4209 domain-containing protein [Blastocatellia bacterium]